MKLRVARHTNQLDLMVEFYQEVLDICQLGSFKNHDTYDGTILGSKELGWQLEFTRSAEKAVHKPDPDDLLVFYPGKNYDLIVNRLKDSGIERIKPKNPYWEKQGYCFSDPDGFMVVIANDPIANELS